MPADFDVEPMGFSLLATTIRLSLHEPYQLTCDCKTESPGQNAETPVDLSRNDTPDLGRCFGLRDWDRESHLINFLESFSRYALRLGLKLNLLMAVGHFLGTWTNCQLRRSYRD